MKINKAQLIILSSLSLYTASSIAASGTQTQASFLLVPTGGALYSVGMEMPMGDAKSNKSLYFQVGGFDYEYTDGDYYEWGSGSLLSAGIKFYSSAENTGMYLGLSLGSISFSGGFDGYSSQGSFSGSGVVPLVTIGNKIDQGSWYLEPNILVGSMSGLSDDASAGVLIALGVTASFPLK